MKIIQDLQDMINEMELNQQPINEIAKFADVLSRNEIMTSNEYMGTGFFTPLTCKKCTLF